MTRCVTLVLAWLLARRLAFTDPHSRAARCFTSGFTLDA